MRKTHEVYVSKPARLALCHGNLMHSTPAASYARCSLEFSGLEDEATRATSGRVGAAEAGACTLGDLPTSADKAYGETALDVFAASRTRWQTRADYSAPTQAPATMWWRMSS